MRHMPNLHGRGRALIAIGIPGMISLGVLCGLGREPAAPDDGPRFVTNRTSEIDLPLPDEEDAFFFGVFGDRTGGPAAGVKVLAQAVGEVNLLEPDLVMTVGDLVEGYNQTPKWMEQMREFKGIMDELTMPWFPVAGNHDVYWRGPDRPPRQHEENYEKHFGPLWYAFSHKNCWFVVLFSDEGNPQTGEKVFNKPAAQTMSPEQFDWLKETLQATAGADHVFLFLHHPRWLKGGYGDDWDRVHSLLVSTGNVSAVFAGHIHRMRYDGRRDGIEYFTLATVGGAQAGDMPEAGYLHQFHLVTVREDRLAVATLPVGTVMDPRAITGEVSDLAREAERKVRPAAVQPIRLETDGAADETVSLTFSNPLKWPVDLSLEFDSADPRWSFGPDHRHQELQPGDMVTFDFQVSRPGGTLDEALGSPEVRLRRDLLADTYRVPLPEREMQLELDPRALTPPDAPARNHVLVLNGAGDCLALDHKKLVLPDGPMTVEGWLRADRFKTRQGFINKTEQAEFGFFLNNGVPAFLIRLGSSYFEAKADEAVLMTGKWHHLAGVFDGAEVRLYVDGNLVGRAPAQGKRKTNSLPLIIGGDVTERGNGTGFFTGSIDEVRISTVARYDTRFKPSRRRRHKPDEQTALLLHMDGRLGPWIFDDSPASAHISCRGRPQVRLADD